MSPSSLPTTYPSTLRMRHAASVAIATLVAVGSGFLFAGCADETDDADAPRTTTTAESGGGTTVAPVHDHATIDVRAVDFAFENLPRTISAGSKLTLQNDAVSELHELVAIRLPDDETRPVPELLQLPEDELGALLSGSPPATVLLAVPGGDQIAAVGDGTIDQPGRYLIMCSIPMGVDPAEYLAAAAKAGGQKPDVPGGPPHFVSGMATDLIVE